ncbi:astacin, partial [Ancylostoma duodenale]
ELEGKEINDMDANRRLVFQKDILLTKSEARDIIDEFERQDKSGSIRNKRQALRRNRTDEQLWMEGVKYAFEPTNASQSPSSCEEERDKLMKGFRLAAKAWEENTCINFTEIEVDHETAENETEIDFLYVGGDGTEDCLSHVGKYGGYQPLILGKGCEAFVYVAHEIGHALGLYHTQSRHDRFQHIKLNWNKISREGLKYEFVKLSKAENRNLQLPYVLAV